MKIYPNPNFPHSARRERTQNVSPKRVIEPYASVDALMNRNDEALAKLEYFRPERTKRASS